MASSGLFAVVEFTEENSVAVVSQSWLAKDCKSTLWPSNIGPNSSNLVIRHSKPEANWKSYPCSVLKRYGTDHTLNCKLYDFINL